jgi:hypothetical protein
MKALAGKRKNDEGLLSSMAESIGSTMGAFVGRANSVQKALTSRPEVRSVKREGKKLRGKSKRARRSTKTKRH